jgi:predicted enzyme related to lactoylglutathione lyase
MTVKTIIYPVRDLAKAKAVFGALLGVEPVADSAYYVGYQVGEQHIGLDPSGRHDVEAGPVPYWHVEDIRKHIELLTGAGAQLRQDAKDVGGGRLTALLTDADGNPVGLVQDA